MFLTLEQFLEQFPPMDISRSDFVKKLLVTYSKPLTLEQLFTMKPIEMTHNGKNIIRKPIIKTTDDLRYKQREQLIDYLYEIIITKRHYYLTLFYKSFFQFKSPDKLTWTGVEIRLPAEKVDLTENPKSFWKTDTTNTADKPDKTNKTNKTNKTDTTDTPTLDQSPHLSLQKNDGGRIMIRNLFYLEILHLTKITNTIKSKVSFWESLVNLYNKLELEDRFFAPSSVALFLREKKTKKNAILKEINYNNLFYLFQAYQPKASILNPYTIKWILDNIFKGKRLFTPVLSWSSYLIAFMHSPQYQEYVGVDVMPSVCQKVKFLADYYHSGFNVDGGYGTSVNNQKIHDTLSTTGSSTSTHPYHPSKKQVNIICSASEDLNYTAHSSKFLQKYKNHFDSVLLCPPYFNMEIYHEGEQSLERYPDYQAWLEGYWRPTVEVCCKTMQKGGRFGVIVNDYYDLKKNFYPLTEDLDKITSQYFKAERVYYLHNRTSPLRANGKTRTERLFIYRK